MKVDKNNAYQVMHASIEFMTSQPAVRGLERSIAEFLLSDECDVRSLPPNTVRMIAAVRCAS